MSAADVSSASSFLSAGSSAFLGSLKQYQNRLKLHTFCFKNKQHRKRFLLFFFFPPINDNQAHLLDFTHKQKAVPIFVKICFQGGGGTRVRIKDV